MSLIRRRRGQHSYPPLLACPSVQLELRRCWTRTQTRGARSGLAEGKAGVWAVAGDLSTFRSLPPGPSSNTPSCDLPERVVLKLTLRNMRPLSSELERHIEVKSLFV